MMHDPETATEANATRATITYNDDITRKFVWASVLWGFVGMLIGLIIALQLADHRANLAPYFTFGRLRPLHTNAVIFAFVGNMVFAGIYYSTQRLLKTRIASDTLSSVHFWGWQAIIVAAAVTLPLGLTQGKEYAELEWPIDLAVTAIWVVFAINFFWTLARRRERHLYVAIWFYIATIVTVAMLYIVNNLSVPWSGGNSYSLFAGVQDALTQWWYGHNAVAFFLTTPVLGIMYYYLPKAAGRPVYSYRLSIVHFWALVFLYIWAGPHHLLYTALPDGAQTLGMIFSLMLWAPSWGGMLNGLLTLRGARDKVPVEGDILRNAFTVHLVNKQGHRVTYTIEGEPREGVSFVIPLSRVTIDALGSANVPVFVSMPRTRFVGDGTVRVQVRAIHAAPHEARVLQVPFLGPSQ